MHSRYRSTEFVTSAGKPAEFPPDAGAEVAFAGRSNAGKSSAINAITGRRALARTSKTPGRTQTINFFRVDDGTRLVDLPGYGFARAPREVVERWSRLVERYLHERRSLAGAVLLMDARRPLMPPDRMLLEWSLAAGLAVHLVLTKADKLKRGPASRALAETRREVRAAGEAVTVQLFSATHGQGHEALVERLDAWLAAGAPRPGEAGPR